jgi:hypothetical protein
MSFHDDGREDALSLHWEAVPGRRGLEPVSLGDVTRQRASEVLLFRFGLLSRWAQEVGGRR